MTKKIESYPELCKFIKNLDKESDLRSIGITPLSQEILNKVKQKGDRLVLLSEVVGSYCERFSIRTVYQFPERKEVNTSNRISDPYKCFRTYSAAFNIIFSYAKKNPQGLYTRISFLNKERPVEFLTSDFPLGKLEPIDGVTMGRIQELVQDLEDNPNHGIDYVFSLNTGQYICPIHVNLNALGVRLRTPHAEIGNPIIMEDFLQVDTKKKKEGEGKKIPYIVYLGKEFDSPVFGFARCFSIRLVDNILYSSNDYGQNGQYTINALYQNTEQRIKRNYRRQPLNRGVVYSTERFIENYDKGLSYEEKFFPPTKFIPSIKHFDNTRKSETLGGKTLRDLEMRDIVRIFPPDELKILKLAIGRAMIGRSGSTEYMNPDFVIYSDWRKAVVTVGPPKIGKSTVIEGVMEGLEFLGYKVCSGIDFSERFNLGQSLLSDISIFDDLTQERLIKNLTSNAFKTIVTNGRMTVEDKGKDKEEVRSETTIIGNANDYTSESLYEVDSGAKNRFVALSAHRAPLGENPWQMAEKIAAELETTKVGIWVRILRECYDEAIKYCAVNGEEPEAGISINDVVDNLSLDNRNYFDSDPGVTLIVFMLIVLGLDKENIDEYIRTIPYDIRDSDRFYQGVEKLWEVLSVTETREGLWKTLCQLWEGCKERMSIHPYLAMRELRWKSLKVAALEIRQIICNSNYDPEDLSEENIELIIGLIRNNNGRIRKSYRGIAKDWRQALDNTFVRGYIKDRIIEIRTKTKRDS